MSNNQIGFVDYSDSYDRTLFVKFNNDGVLTSLNYCSGTFCDWDFTADNPQLRDFVVNYLSPLGISKFNNEAPLLFINGVNSAIDEYIKLNSY